MMTHAIRALLALLLMFHPAHAGGDSSAPWAKDVSDEQQRRANAMFAEANALFAQQAHPAALEKYRAAVALWDHPQIRFNMAVTLIRLERWIEAADALDASLRFGTGPFTPELHRRALDYQAQVRAHVGTLDASCTQRGVEVSLDGKPWFSCPGTRSARVPLGEHAIVAEGAGFMTTSRRVAVAGGATRAVPLELHPIATAVVIEEPRRRWAPWIVTGLGVAAGATGAGVWFVGYKRMDGVNARFAQECALGCDESALQALRAERARARREGTIGTAMMIGGGAMVLGGIVWAVIDRPRRSRPAVEIAPARGGLTASAGWRF
jgi:hypothetical protein